MYRIVREPLHCPSYRGRRQEARCQPPKERLQACRRSTPVPGAPRARGPTVGGGPWVRALPSRARPYEVRNGRFPKPSGSTHSKSERPGWPTDVWAPPNGAPQTMTPFSYIYGPSGRGTSPVGAGWVPSGRPENPTLTEAARRSFHQPTLNGGTVGLVPGFEI